MGLIDTYIEYVKPYKGSPRYHEAVALSMVSSMIEKRIWYPKGDMKLYLNQYIFLVGGPGTGKTFACDLGTDQIHKYNKSLGPANGGIKFGPNKATPAAFLHALKRLQKTIKSPAHIFDQSAMYLYTRELSSIIKDIGGGSFADDLLDLYDMADQDYVKELVGEGIIKIIRPCLNILACTTPTFLSSFMPREQSGTGLTARILFANEPKMHEKSYDEVRLDPKLDERIQKHLARLHRTIGAIRRTKESDEFLKDQDKKSMNKLRDGVLTSFLENFYARKTEHIIKVASAYSLSESSNLTLELKHLERAVKFIEEQEKTIYLAFGVSDIRRNADSSKIILDAIPYHTCIAKDALLQKLFGNGLAGTMQEIDGLLTFLSEGNLIECKNMDGITRYRRIDHEKA